MRAHRPANSSCSSPWFYEGPSRTSGAVAVLVTLIILQTLFPRDSKLVYFSLWFGSVWFGVVALYFRSTVSVYTFTEKLRPSITQTLLINSGNSSEAETLKLKSAKKMKNYPHPPPYDI